MSHQAVCHRAADIRQTWSRNERWRRAVASDLRCLDLLVRITASRDRRTLNWSAKPSA